MKGKEEWRKDLPGRATGNEDGRAPMGRGALELECSGSWNPSVDSGEEPDFYTDL